MKTHFLEIDGKELDSFLVGLGAKAYRRKQVWDWLFSKRVANPERWSNLPKVLVADLLTQFNWDLPEPVETVHGEDGSTKLLLKTHSGHLMETVIMRYENRTSLCVSSQVGCRLACSFCQTGKLGFFRHLAAHEILSQFLLAEQIVQAEERSISNVVFMGMGEPLDNFEAVIVAANRLIDDYGLSHRRVTLSTSGMAPRIEELHERTKAALAISLHAAEDQLRTQLMPINRRYNLATLKAALQTHQQQTGKKLTIEYILIKDVNCSVRHAKQLVHYLHGLRAKINLIPFNAHPGLEYARPSEAEILAFQKYLSDRSFPAPVRYSKGLDVSGACGQLAAKVSDALHQAPRRKSVVAANDPS